MLGLLHGLGNKLYRGTQTMLQPLLVLVTFLRSKKSMNITVELSVLYVYSILYTYKVSLFFFYFFFFFTERRSFVWMCVILQGPSYAAKKQRRNIETLMNFTLNVFCVFFLYCWFTLAKDSKHTSSLYNIG